MDEPFMVSKRKEGIMAKKKAPKKYPTE